MKRTRIQMLTDFLEGLNTMIDAASQAIHQRQNIKFMDIRAMLNIIKDDAVKLLKDEK